LLQRLIINAVTNRLWGIGRLAVKLNKCAFEHAKQMVKKGSLVSDEKDMWSEHQPSSEEENKYIEINGRKEYGKWYLGLDTDENEDTKGRYKFPYSNFTRVHRCGVLSAESRAGQYKYFDIEKAAAHLHGMIDVVKK
jgi:hypothetical protein